MTSISFTDDMHFDKNGDAAKCITEGGFYIWSSGYELLFARKVRNVWENNKADPGLSLYETIQLLLMEYEKPQLIKNLKDVNFNIRKLKRMKKEVKE